MMIWSHKGKDEEPHFIPETSRDTVGEDESDSWRREHDLVLTGAQHELLHLQENVTRAHSTVDSVDSR